MMTLPTIDPRFDDVAAIIGRALRDGIALDDGNVIDLLADNIEAPLDDLRAALARSAFASRFPKACAPQSKPVSTPTLRANTMTEDQGKKAVAITTIVAIMKHADLLQGHADELSAQSNALGDEAAIIASLHEIDWDKDVLPVLALMRSEDSEDDETSDAD
jgi:hypothetical protein